MRRLPLFESSALKALTVQQPWAELIVSGRKTIENRTWITEYRGQLYIHAGKRLHPIPMSEIERRHDVTIDRDALQFSAIIGRVELVDIVTRSNSPYFEGPYGWVLKNPISFTPIPLRGQMGLFDLSPNIMRRLVAAALR